MKKGLSFREKLSCSIINIPGWRTQQRIVVFDSDDWGSIRMPSKMVYEKLIRNGIPVDQCSYSRNDSLASEEDLQDLFDTLMKFKDKNGNYPVFTANTVVANPDFEKIKNNNFNNYYYEPFSKTLERYPKHKSSFNLWTAGIKEKIFYPQFHGREHLNVKLWLSLLRGNNSLFRKGFDLGLWSFGPSLTGDYSFNIQASFDFENKNEINEQKKIIIEGLNLFEKLFGYRSNSFVANNFIWDADLHYTLAQSGVKVLKTMKYQVLPKYYIVKHKFIRRKLGEKNQYNQIYLIRNVTFEPSQKPSNYDNVGKALSEIQVAFFMNKPAIIDTHRLNYIGFLNRENKINNLKLLNELLALILKKWPDVVFMNTTQLADLMESEI